MVAITVASAAVVAIVVTSSGDQLNDGSANAKVELEPSPVGLQMKIEQISTDGEVLLNGVKYATVSKDSAGQVITLPTTPGDKIVLTSGNRESSVLVSKTVEDRSEIGDFIAYWNFNGDSTPVKDQSGNGNDLQEHKSEPTFKSNHVVLSESLDDAMYGDISASEEVTGFTIAVNYKPHDTSHNRDGACGGCTGLETFDVEGGDHITIYTRSKAGGADEYAIRAEVPGTEIQVDDLFNYGERRQVVVAWEGGEEVRLYTDDGQSKTGSTSKEARNALGNVGVGADVDAMTGSDPNHKEVEGEYYSIRIYYDALDEGTIESIFNGMGG
jgi:hypothetical protein